MIDHDIPGDAPQPPPEPPITTTGDLRFEEWRECRDLIGRLDGTLADLRKYGFSLVTTLLTAGGIVTSLTNGRPARAVASEVIMVLVAALFGLDAYYSTALGGAVDRALNLELLTRPRIWVTWYLRVSVVKAKSLLLTVTLYIALLATSSASACSAGTARHPSPTGSWSEPSRSSSSSSRSTRPMSGTAPASAATGRITATT